MAYGEVYTRINWQNEPSKATSLGETNLNKMDSAIKTLDSRVVELDVTKAPQATVLNLVSNWTMDKNTGVITITKLNGTTMTFDLNIEKIPVSFDLSYDGILTMTTDDGSKFTADIGSMIPVLTFNGSQTVAVTTTGSGINKTYFFSIVKGSITDEYLQPNYLADITKQAQSAKTSAANAELSATEAAASVVEAANQVELATEQAEIAKEHRLDAEDSADRAEQALSQINDAIDVNVPTFTLNLATGHMEYTGSKFVFTVNTDTGHLEWEVAI